MKRYNYRINNLDCANCANKIECKLNEHKDIENAIVNFNKLTVSITTDNNNPKELVEKIAKEIEPEVIILDNDEKIKNKIIYDICLLVMGIILGLLGMFLVKGLFGNILIIISYVMLLYKVFIKAIKLLIKKTIDENLLISISCIGAYLTNNIHEGLMVIALYDIGKILENIAVNNTRKAISDAMNIRSEYANVYRNNDYIKVMPEDVKVGEIIRVLKGERIPLDGEVISGNSKLDMRHLTGESRLVKVNSGDKVLSGSINTNNVIEIKVDSSYEDSTVARILSLVETATDRKAKTETFVSKVAKIYTPVVLILAILTVIILPLLFKVTISQSIYRALVFLVISCPCAIAISVPLSYFSGIGRAAKDGILIKGSDYLDNLGNVLEIIFDKTGTLTTGEFNDYKLEVLDNKYNKYNKEEIINYYVMGEELSNHPIAKSIVKIFNINNKDKVNNFKEVTGKGIQYEIMEKKIKIGNGTFCNSNNDGAIYLNIDNKNVAKLILFDGVKNNVINTIDKLKKMGINVKIFTGDNKEYAMIISNKIGINDVNYELLPEDKFNLLEKDIIKYNNHVAFVGDGINDAPALARSNIGISLGGVGSAAAIEASDIVIMNDEIDKIVTGINISRYTNKIIKENLIFAIGTKILVLLLSVLGIASMWQAVFADTGVTLITILNTTRILKMKDRF